jgi:uncharacterized protein YciI
LKRLWAEEEPMAHFLLKLRPPRTSFISDMTEAEAGLMSEHAAYLKSAEGVLLFGPVADPAGAWGLAVVSAADEKAAEAITQKDPLIRANTGFSYEIPPMLAAVAGTAYPANP